MGSNFEKAKVNGFSLMQFGNHLYPKRSDTESTDGSFHISPECEPHTRYLIAQPGVTNNADELHEPTSYKSRLQVLEYTEQRDDDSNLVAEPDELVDIPFSHEAAVYSAQQQIWRYTKHDLIRSVMKYYRELSHVGAQFDGQLMATFPREYAHLWSPGQRMVPEKKPEGPLARLSKPRSGTIVKDHIDSILGEEQAANDKLRQRLMKTMAECGSKALENATEVKSSHRPQLKSESPDKAPGQVLDGLEYIATAVVKDESVSSPNCFKATRRRSSSAAVDSLSETPSKIEIKQLTQDTSHQPTRRILPAVSSIHRSLANVNYPEENASSAGQAQAKFTSQNTLCTEEDAPTSNLRDAEISEDDEEETIACIFWIYNPDRNRRCAGLKAKSLAALKQHFRRRHFRPEHYCSKCYREFTSAEDKDAHVRESSCLLKPQGRYLNDTLNSEAMNLCKKKIVQRRRGQEKEDANSRAKLEAAWMDIYRAQFRTQQTPKLPFVGKLSTRTAVMHVMNMINVKPSLRSVLQSISDDKQGPGEQLPTSTQLVLQESLKSTGVGQMTDLLKSSSGPPVDRVTEFSGSTVVGDALASNDPPIEDDYFTRAMDNWSPGDRGDFRDSPDFDFRASW